MADVIPYDRFKDALERKRDPNGYAGRKIVAAIDKQVRASEESKHLLIGETPELDEGFDAGPVIESGAYWTAARDHYEKQRLLNKYLTEQAQGDPGDEI
jgi:hypothetical protein